IMKISAPNHFPTRSRSCSTVSDFKAKVQTREGVAVSQQRLVFQGREMASGKLSDYCVKEHSTIDMMMRLRGG
uniref:Ubiquitin-like domain-containing protein n=1 Tax=Labrus bergylta TaxID=56723 RepID=A0A3Q3LLL5_9LABR